MSRPDRLARAPAGRFEAGAGHPTRSAPPGMRPPRARGNQTGHDPGRSPLSVAGLGRTATWAQSGGRSVGSGEGVRRVGSGWADGGCGSGTKKIVSGRPVRAVAFLQVDAGLPGTTFFIYRPVSSVRW